VFFFQIQANLKSHLNIHESGKTGQSNNYHEH